MNCPRCTAHISVTPDEVIDTPTGIVAVIAQPIPTLRRACVCGWTFTLVSSIGHQPRKGVA